MDPKLVYWTAAFVNMVGVVGAALAGVLAVRRGMVSIHRRCMLLAAMLVVAFVVSYVFKVAVLGREDLARWSTGAVVVLRVHELCVLVMLVGGAWALRRAIRLWRDPIARGEPSLLAPDHPLRAGHRRAGWTAVTGALLGVITAAIVLFGMYQRAAAP